MSDTLLEIRAASALGTPADSFEQVSLIHLYGSLSRLFPEDDWTVFEPETIELHLGVELTPLLRDKVEVLRTLLGERTCQDNASFVLHACSVVNNEVADFNAWVLPNSLELAYYIVSLHDLQEASDGAFTVDVTPALVEVSTHVLQSDGYSVTVPPFQFLEEYSYVGQLSTDTSAKAEAVSSYVSYMRSL